MKRFISIFTIILLIMTALTISVSAHSGATGADSAYDYEIDGTEYTVIFTDSTLSAEKQEQVALELIGAAGETVAPCSSCSSGHTYGEESIITVITHKYVRFEPRCKEDIYAVSECRVCGYINKEFIIWYPIDCCPAKEDATLN